jgi:O-antigen ligase
LHSQNLGFRVIGLVEYCKLHGGDIGNMLFGVGKKLYDTPDSYSDAFWNLTLGRGTYESGILNILVKNGAIGFIPYFYMIIKPLRKALICPRKREHTLLLALVIPMALSLIPELFFTQIRYTYTLFTLCYISYFYHNEMTPINDLKVFPQERSNC